MSKNLDPEEQYQELELQHQEGEHSRENGQLISQSNRGGTTTTFLCSTPVKILAILVLVISIVVVAVVSQETASGKENSNRTNHEQDNPNRMNIKKQVKLPKHDQSNYELLTLPKNKLKVLLITSHNLKISAASLDVRVGSMNNPTQFQGLAHLLEHMLFMGSDKYPQEDTFNSLVSKSGGGSNAYTSLGNTNYYFEGTHNNFEEILDVWSRFFIDPLLKEDQLQREVQAVDSEYVNTLTREGFRLFNLFIALTDDNHPFKLFVCGNIDSLITIPKQKGLSTYNALHSFKKRYYNSESMSLVIKTDVTLRDQLKDSIITLFSDIPTSEQNKATYNQQDEAITANDKKETVNPPISKAVHSVLFEDNQIKKLVLSFFLEYDNNSEFTSIEFVRDLMLYGFDGINLCYLLQDDNLGTDCEISAETEDGTLNSFLLFSVELQFLANEDCIEDIVQRYFYFINSVAKYPNKKQAYKQIKEIKKGLFNILDNSFADSVMDEVSQYSKMVNLNRTKDIQSSDQLYQTYNEDHFNRIISVLNDTNKIVIIHKTSNSTFIQGKTLLQDKINNLNYTKSDITSNQQSVFKAWKLLKLPKITPVSDFGAVNDKLLKVPDSFKDDTSPKSVLMNEKGRVYILKDKTTFKKPMQTIYLKFENPILSQDVESRIANKIITQMLKKEIQRKAHLLTFSGLSVEVNMISQNGGFTFEITCLDSQVESIMQKVRESVDMITTHLLANQTVFDSYKLQQIDALNNYINQMIYQQFMDIFNSYFVCNNQYSAEQMLSTIKNVTLQNVKQNISSFVDTYFLTIYAFGNVDEGQIQQSFDLLSSKKRREAYSFTAEYLDTKEKAMTLQLLNNNSGDKVNSLCSNYYHIGKLDINELVLLKLIDKPLKSQAFNYLRTQLQLGYVVTSKILSNSDYYGIIILVQGSKHNPDVYDLHIEEFLQIFETFLTGFEDDEIQSMQESLIQTLSTDKFEKFTDKSKFFWPEINQKSYNYQQNQELIKILQNQTFTAKDLKNFFVKYLKNSNSRLSFQLFSPSRVKQSDLPIKPMSERVYSGSYGTLVKSREQFNQQQFSHLQFKDAANSK